MEKNGKRARTIRAAICMRKVITLMRAVRYYFVIIMYFHYVVHVGTRFYLASQSSHGRVDRQDYLAQHLDPERTSSDYVNAAAYGNLPSRLALRSTTTRRRQAGAVTSAISPASEIRDIMIDVDHPEWLIDDEHFLAFTEDYESDSAQK